MFVENILKQKGTNVTTTTAETPIADAANTMIDQNIGLLIVMSDNGTIKGILSERDIVRGLAENHGDAKKLNVGQLMTTNVTTCEPSDSLQKVTSVMTAHRVRHLPVMNSGKVSGLISIGDVLKFRLEESLLDEESMRNYVAGKMY